MNHKIALLIGINYANTKSELKGCINDTKNLKDFLLMNNFDEENITILTDTPENNETTLNPTKDNIIAHFNNLIDYANNNKKNKIMLFVSFSGHGIKRNPKHTSLCAISPVDGKSNGIITSGYIKRHLVNRLHKDVQLIMLMDCCHSGSIVELKYKYKLGWTTKYTQNNKTRETKCNAVLISSCKDDEKSSDKWADENQGVLTSAFIKCYKNGISYRTLMRKISGLIERKYKQEPQISSSNKIQMRGKLRL